MPENAGFAAVEFHSLPIKTYFEGTTNVAENFSSRTRSSTGVEDEPLTNTFRGRFLQGQMICTPKDYSIALLSFSKADPGTRASAMEESIASEVCLVSDANHVFASSDRFVQWEHDRRPENTDTISNWVNLANDLHT
ncbi:hypothetical protein STCU_02580 [Strigomonas culicis]|uniref:Uncharacterized protein n=1 Tax=Strigomonas culicis TaxID=28005 RepID=S9UPT0_9TRYP|nr:hypothetical protein STCU_02580 [Strigomonas culicis]|eukprot:EPY32912.1 hypothetical protein STCU_02580 [Strigomonas culicis]